MNGHKYFIVNLGVDIGESTPSFCSLDKGRIELFCRRHFGTGVQ